MANMGVPEKKISPYFYAAVIGCIVAMPIVMCFGYLLDLSAGDNGKIFGSVTAKEIAEIIKKDYNIDVDKRKISLDGNIKTCGRYNITVKFIAVVTAKIIVVIAE